MKVLILLSIFLCLSGCAQTYSSDATGDALSPTETIEPFDTSELAGTTVLVRVTKEQFNIVKNELVNYKDIYIEWYEYDEFAEIEVYGDRFDEAIKILNEVIYGTEETE